MLFKEGNWPDDRGSLERLWRRFDGVEGAIPWAWIVASIPQQISFNFASEYPAF